MHQLAVTLFLNPSLAGFTNEAGRGMAALYSLLLQPDRDLRWPFMRTLIRCFDTASDLLTSGAAEASLG